METCDLFTRHSSVTCEAFPSSAGPISVQKGKELADIFSQPSQGWHQVGRRNRPHNDKQGSSGGFSSSHIPSSSTRGAPTIHHRTITASTSSTNPFQPLAQVAEGNDLASEGGVETTVEVNPDVQITEQTSLVSNPRVEADVIEVQSAPTLEVDDTITAGHEKSLVVRTRESIQQNASLSRSSEGISWKEDSSGRAPVISTSPQL